ncbi:hypothetical protein [Leptospira sp. 'Mane']|uniref:hypothetical protein n=1 Tax=Leptospira sp. 'Mane' TaxID=3387407 RepID=UPI00398B469C
MKKITQSLVFFLLLCGSAVYGESLVGSPLFAEEEITAVEQSLSPDQISASWEREAESYRLDQLKELIKIHEMEISRFHTGNGIYKVGSSSPSNDMQKLGSVSSQFCAFGANQSFIHKKADMESKIPLVQTPGLSGKNPVIISYTDRKIKHIQGMSHDGPPISS